LVQDPCRRTTFVSAPIEDFISFMGQEVTSTYSYTFTDSIATLAGISDYCGPKAFNFKINSVDTDELTWTNGGKIVFKPDLNSLDYGTFLA